MATLVGQRPAGVYQIGWPSGGNGQVLSSNQIKGA